jgi:acetyl-CoA acetyltransferase
VNDGAAAIMVTSASFAHERGLEPLAVIRAWASAGVKPADTGLAPSVAIPKALDRAGLKIADVDLWEINEAFASVPVAATRELGIDDAIVNVLGSGCSLGHPVAMTGARMVLTLVYELRRWPQSSSVCISACVSCWNTRISRTSPSATVNSSTTSTVAHWPVDFAVHVCVVTCTT